MGERGLPQHSSGVVAGEPGLYFVGLPFLHAFSSGMIHGVARDAQRIAGIISERVRNEETAESIQPANSLTSAV